MILNLKNLSIGKGLGLRYAKKKRTKTKTVVFLIAIAVVFLAVLATRGFWAEETDTKKELPEISLAADSYGKYLNPYEKVAYPETEIVIFGGDFIEASDGFHQDSIYFYFNKGTNTITLESTQEPVIIGQLILDQEEENLEKL